MDGFTSCDVYLDDGLTIRAATAGRGTPLLLLLHGHPQTLATWRKVAPILAESFSVVACDLRGYGDSSKPDGGLDHVARASRLALLDIAPTATMYARTDKAFATRYFSWFFLIQPAPFPEQMIGLDPEYFLRHHIDGQLKVEGATDPAAFAEYLRRYRNPATIHAICEDYRAAAGIDLEHDAEDGERRIAAPLLALWGARGTRRATLRRARDVAREGRRRLRPRARLRSQPSGGVPGCPPLRAAAVLRRRGGSVEAERTPAP